MKNLCIVTVYNSINSGSYWQAKALGEYLGKNNSVFYLRRNDVDASSHPVKKIKRVLKRLIELNIKGFVVECKTIRRFSRLEKGFRTIKTDDEIMKDIDCIVLGSDTIWNLNNKYFAKNYKKYFGGIFDNKRIITYAPSVANTSITMFRERPEIIDMLKNIECLSVRDQRSAKVIKSLIKINPAVVCDPTMLLTKEDYLGQIKGRLIKDKFIFLYLFDTLTKAQVLQLRHFAKNNNLKIVSGAEYLNFADECFVNAPDLFLQNMVDAEYVITDTFHGTIFSALLNKQFITIDRGKDKVMDALKKIKLEDRLVRKNDESFILHFQDSIDYTATNHIIEKIREESKKYLNESINGGN